MLKYWIWILSLFALGEYLPGNPLLSLFKKRCVGVVAAVCGSGCNGLGLHVDHYTVIAVGADAECVCVCVGESGGGKVATPSYPVSGNISWGVCER